MKPIIFSTPMVQAILDGRKTMTRRVVTNKYFLQWTDDFADEFIKDPDNDWLSLAPYKPGDILWVRETWRIGAWDGNYSKIAIDYKADNFSRREWIHIDDEKRFEDYWIQSTDDADKAGIDMDENGEYHWKPGEAPTRWRPSIFMPKESARIFLKVKNVRVERIQNMNFYDWQADFCPDISEQRKALATFSGHSYMKQAMKNLWDSLNAKRGYSWESNPWVWVIEFERASADGKEE